MCGILCICSRNASDLKLLEIFEKCKENLQRRGPDSLGKEIIKQSGYNLLLGASILWLQGINIVRQPVITDKSAMVYNGDVFSSSLISDEDRAALGDTKLLLNRLESAANARDVLQYVQGPYAFVYLNRETSKLYFARDVFGRRSLLIGKTENTLVLASVASVDFKFHCMELPAVGIFCLDLISHKISLNSWQFENKNFLIKLNELKEFLCEDIHVIRDQNALLNKLFIEPASEDVMLFKEVINLNVENIFEKLLSIPKFLGNVVRLNNLLENAVRTRISTQPRFCQTCISQRDECSHSLLGVLFSGGLDCTILALLADKFSGVNHPIDLFNVAFQNRNDYLTPDRLTGIASFEELKSLRPNRKWNFVEVNVTEDELNVERSQRIRHLIFPLNTILDDSLGCALWFASKGESSVYKSPCRVCIYVSFFWKCTE